MAYVGCNCETQELAFQFKKYFPLLAHSIVLAGIITDFGEEETMNRLLSDLPGPPLALGVPPSLVAQVHVLTERSLRVFFLMCCCYLLSQPLTMAGVLVLYSISLFALSLESEFYYGRKCSSEDQINVLVTFVPGQQGKCLPDLFQEQNSLCSSRRVF